MKLKTLSAVALTLVGATVAEAATLNVSITNLTRGMSFTPRLLVAHNENIDLFEPGQPGTRALAWMAEAGVIVTAQNAASSDSNFEHLLELPENADNNTWQGFGLMGGPLPPATESATYTFDSEDF